MTLQEILDTLQPRGTEPLVRLTIQNLGFVEHQLVQDCIKDLAQAATLARAGLAEVGPCQQLVLQILQHSAETYL